MKVGIYSGKGANPRRLAALLRRFGFEVRSLDRADLARLAGLELDVLYLPGGWYRFSDAENRAVRRFVRGGRGCVGSCAGAYNVAAFIPLIPGAALRCNLRGRLYLEPRLGGHPILRGVVRRCTRHRERRWEPIAVTHLGGPMILPADPACIVASYDTDDGRLGAIAAAAVGRGRAVAIASHPEHPLAALPAGDTVKDGRGGLPRGDARLIIRNAVLWSARRRVPSAS